jgi:phytoene dehydrogenase-like protein
MQVKPEETEVKPDVTSNSNADSTAITKEATEPENATTESATQIINDQSNQQQQQQFGGGGMDPNMMMNMMNMMGMMGGMGGMMGGMNPMMAMQAQAAQVSLATELMSFHGNGPFNPKPVARRYRRS